MSQDRAHWWAFRVTVMHLLSPVHNSWLLNNCQLLKEEPVPWRKLVTEIFFFPCPSNGHTFGAVHMKKQGPPFFINSR
jgi:hypothetical protein